MVQHHSRTEVQEGELVDLPECVLESGRIPYTDIADVTFEVFMKNIDLKVDVLRRVHTTFANQPLSPLWIASAIRRGLSEESTAPRPRSTPVPALGRWQEGVGA